MATFFQAGALPFRTTSRGHEYLLVTSQKGNWIFPKGIIEPEESAEEAALKEAREEAGIIGSILPGPLGTYIDRKWQHPCEVQIFLLEYAGESDSWEDCGLRYRRWCDFIEASRLLKKPDLRAILEKAEERLAPSRPVS
ncbi:MAG TPA: NUDIX domain-containing protein [Planctomycetota bacterium]|nr:NUDIX domain-containing protein [Planctomycetota bacterium]